MVAYSFKWPFREAILSGKKRQTIRAERKRHARPGEWLQAYTGMRSAYCSIIGSAICVRVEPIIIGFGARPIVMVGEVTEYRSPAALDDFARRDGFSDWRAMEKFWCEEHGDGGTVSRFEGVVISWRGLVVGVRKLGEAAEGERGDDEG